MAIFEVMINGVLVLFEIFFIKGDDKRTGKTVRMSTYILMKILEKTPKNYDSGIRLITRGRLEKSYERITSLIQKGQEVLDVGCGTGALTFRAARRGAKVKGIDVNPEMLEVAQQRANEEKLSENVRLAEIGVAELGKEKGAHYDVVMSGLCFSELNGDEINYTLEQVRRILKPGGLLIVADEVCPQNILRRLMMMIPRFFIKMITYLLTQKATRALKNLPEKIRRFGFLIERVRLNRGGNFIELVARKPKP